MENGTNRTEGNGASGLWQGEMGIERLAIEKNTPGRLKLPGCFNIWGLQFG